MISLVETGLMNALLAVVLALPVFALGRICHRPALIHAFWILVLIKLIAPPLYLIPVPVNLPAHPAAQISDGVAAQAVPQPRSVARSPASSNRSPNNSATQLPRSPAEVPLAVSASAIASAPHAWTVSWQAVAGTGLQLMQRLAWPVLLFWFCGSACWFAWQGWCVVRFTQVFLKYSRCGPPRLQRLAQRLAQQMGISRAPEVWLLPAVVSPMLWSVGGQPRILFPRDLLSRLDEGAVATLLTHELAHYRRGDHHVRLLEFLASGLFWWHPLIWLARRELEISEEKCCDAWVVSQFPAAQRQYADALLATVDFLTEDHPALPATACGLGEVPLLRQRLKLIMRGTAPKSISLLGRAAIVATALLIPISPTVRLREQAPVLEAGIRPAVTSPRDAAARRTVATSRQADSPLTEIAARPVKSHNSNESAIVAASSIPPCSLPNPGCTGGSDDTKEHVPVLASGTSPENPPLADTTSEFVLRVFQQSPEHTPATSPDLRDLLDVVTCHSDSALFLAQGKVSLTCSRGAAIRVWNLQDSPQAAASLHRSNDNQDSGCEAKKSQTEAPEPDLASYWDVDEFQKIEPVTMTPHGVHSLAISPRGLMLAITVGQSKAAKLLILFTADGKLRLAREWRGTLVNWDLGTQIRVTR